MHRFYYPSQNISSNKIIINDKEQIHYIRDVLRLNSNDEVFVFDDKGNEYLCLIKELLDNKAILEIKEGRTTKLGRIKITLACAIPKKSKMDEIVDKLTQLGVDKIIPLETERVIVKLDKNKKILRHKRWEKIAQNAAQQSQRNTLPIIEPIKNIEEVLSQSKDYDLKLIPTLSGERRALREILAKPKAKNILVLIGPEGDFTLKEINLAKKAGCILVSLGDLVLRIETAAVAIVSFIRLYENG